jgi:hypothetical protein
MQGTGQYGKFGLLNIKRAAINLDNKELYSRQTYICWTCQQGKKKDDVKVTRPFGFGTLRKIICHDCSAAAKKRKQEKDESSLVSLSAEGLRVLPQEVPRGAGTEEAQVHGDAGNDVRNRAA